MRTLLLITVLLTQSLINGQANFKTSEHAIKSLPNDKKAIGVAGGILQNGEELWSCSSGYSNRETNTPFTTKTLTRTASIAKPMTALAVMQLFEKGLVDLEAPIQNYVKDFPEKEEGTITVRHLLNHSSGIPAYKNGKEAHDAPHYETLTDAMNVFKNRDLISTPGVEEFYTTYGYVVLGVLIERVSGMSYEDYMTVNIWNPAGMKNTGVEHAGRSYENKSLLYDLKKKGKIKQIDSSNDLSNRIPGGGLYSTVEDLLLFGNAVLKNTLISEETLALMLEEQGVKYDGNPYALGWFLYNQNGERKDIFGHAGSQKGCSSQLMIVPKRDLVVVVLSNTSGVWGEVIGASSYMINDAVAHLNTRNEVSK